MKILFFARLFSPHVGGVEKHVFEISKRLISQGHKVIVLTEQYDSKLLLNDKIDRIKILRIPVPSLERNKKFVIWKWLYKNRQLMKDADIIHCHDVFFWYLPFRFIFSKPVFTTFHGYEGYPIKKKAVLYRKLFAYMSNKTICVGEFMKKWYRAKPTFVTYGAIDLPKKPFEPAKNSSIVFVGRLDDQTGIDMYVDAFNQIRKHDHTFSFTVYGDGPFRKKIKGEGIVLKGFDPSAEKEIPKYEYAFVSRYLAILEAMVAKRLVFAVFDNKIKEDYLKMTPFKDWMIVCDTPETLAREVLYYKKNPREANQKIEKAYAWVKNQTWERLTEEYLHLWKSEVR